jgi:hypothetical protein
MALRRSGAALCLLLTASMVSAQAQSNWVLYAPKGPGFRVELPMQPKVNTANIKTTYGPAKAAYFFFKGENGLEGRMEVRDYDRGQIKDARGFLDESRSYYENRKPLRSESRFSLSGNPSHKFVTNTADGRVATIEEVMIDDRFISVICFTPKGQERSPDAERIFRSFAVIRS